MNCASLRIALLLAAFALPACGVLPKVVKVLPHRKRIPRATAAPQPMLVGTVALVNETSRFVLIDNGDLPGPSSGAVLKSYTGPVESAQLLATEVRRRPFLIADIKSGAPKKGDRVMLPPSSAAATATPAPRTAAAVPAPSTPEPKRRGWSLWPFGKKRE